MALGVVWQTAEFLKKQIKYSWFVIHNPKLYKYAGLHLPLRATPELQSVRKMFYIVTYERAEIDVIRSLLRRDDIVLEVGAGCGVVTASIANQLSDSRNIYAFEANPSLMRSIESIAAANELSPTIRNAGVGLEDGIIDFFVDDQFLSSSSINRSRPSRKVTVKTVSIRTLLTDVRPTFIVFDIEGAEKEVLSVEFPSHVRVLCGELHPHIIGDHEVSRLIRDILNQGFDLLVDCSRGRCLAFARPEARVGQIPERSATG